MTDYSELKRLAETADKKMPTFGAGIAHRQAFRDATSPATVLELIAEVERLEDRVSDVSWQLGQVSGVNEMYQASLQKMDAEIENLRGYQQGAKAEADAADEARTEVRKLRAENEALRKDAERYRWLMSDAIYNGTLGVRDGWIDFEFKDEAQEQIDYCMKEDAE